MLTFVETTLFTSLVGQYLSDDEYAALQQALTANPEAGDLIEGTGGLRKVRWGLSGRGKSGGMRVITYCILPDGEIWLLMAYTKAKFDNLPADFLVALKKELFND